MKRNYKLLIISFLFGTWMPVNAQDVQSTDEIQSLKQEIELLKARSDSYKPGLSRFLLRGYAHSGFQVF